MISAPPIKSALLHVKPRVDFVLSEVSSAKLIGESGVVVMIAPLPVLDSSEEPYRFKATTLALTLDPHSSEYGVDLSTVTGIMHVVAIEVYISQ